MSSSYFPKCVCLLILIISLKEINSKNQTKSKNLKDWWKAVSTAHPRYNETTKLLKSISKAYPKQFKYYSIGKSVQGREMWVMRIGQDVSKMRPLLTPPLKIVANMHGDEAIGRALILMLAVDIISKFAAKDQRVSKLLKSSEIHLMPSINPDGFEASEEGACDPDPEIVGRNNANVKDLNRNFPEQWINNETSLEKLLKGKEPETKNMIKWITSTDFVLSANLHALSLVASYPFDSVSPKVEADPNYRGMQVISKTPDHDFYFYLATLYATNHKVMSKPNDCTKNDLFKKGVTNGAEWYNVKGGLQDFTYLHSNTFEITLELSCCKFPAGKDLLKEWDDNREALYKYLEAGQMGVKGRVIDSHGGAIKGAVIHVKDIKHNVKTNSRGEYWRLLMPGNYQVWAEAKGYKKSDMVKVQLKKGSTLPFRKDFKLKK